MRQNAKFTVERIDELELITHHDVVAFTRCVSESLGDDAKWLHYGLTSSDVGDTALCRILVDTCNLLEADLLKLISVLKEKADQYRHVPCMGRTHGIHAEPTTFGLKFLLWLSDAQRNLERLQQARAVISVGKLSGAVGNYGNLDPSWSSMSRAYGAQTPPPSPPRCSSATATPSTPPPSPSSAPH